MSKNTNEMLSKPSGIISARQKGIGFVTGADGVGIFVPPFLMKRFVPGDVVSYEVGIDEKKGLPAVISMDLIQRNETFWLGILAKNFYGDIEFVPDDPMYVKLKLPYGHGKQFSEDPLKADVLQVKVPAGGLAKSHIPVCIVADLGPRNDREFDAAYAAARWRIPSTWSQEVLDEANAISLSENVMSADSEDLRYLPFVTIDSASTHDRDDAIFAEIDGTNIRLKVAIADVSKYVRPGSAIDDEARRRGTSVYFPGQVIPMLPEVLSNGLCSLNPGVDRSALVCSMEINSLGHILSSSFSRATIRSHGCLTYNSVADYLRGEDPFSTEISTVIDAVKIFYDRKSKERSLRGLNESQGQEPKLATDSVSQGFGYSVDWDEITMAHGLVEECMLAANTEAAKKRPLGNTSHIYRHHQGLDVEKWSKTRDWLQKEGIEISESPSLEELRDLLSAEKLNARYPLIEYRIRGSFAPAIYDHAKSNHFTLGLDAYTHFTSPIRRYADLLAHRLLLSEISTLGCGDALACTEFSHRAQRSSGYVWSRLKRRSLANQDNKGPYTSQVISTFKRGIKVIVNGWGTGVFCQESNLLEAGYSWSSDHNSWIHNSSQTVMEEGMLIDINILGIVDPLTDCDLLGEISDMNVQK